MGRCRGYVVILVAVKGVSPPCVGPFQALPGRGFLSKTVPRIAEKKDKKSGKIVDKPGRLGYIIDRE